MLVARRSRRPATRRARTSRSRMDPAVERAVRGRRATCSSTRAARCPPAELADYWADLAARYPILSIEDGMDEEDWDGWQTLTERLGATRPARRRRPVRHEHRAPQARHRARGRQLDPHQGQPDRHAHRDARRDPHGARGRLHRRHVAPLGGDRGRHDRRPRGRDRLRADQDGRPVALGPRGEVQPAPAHRGAARRATPPTRVAPSSAASRAEAGPGRHGGEEPP